MVLPVGDVNPVRRRTWLVWLLAAASVAVLLRQLTLEGCEQLLFTYRWSAVPRELLTLRALPPEALRVLLGDCAAAVDFQKNVPLSALTAMFVHGGLGHLVGNLIYLLVFGNNVEDRLGHARFAVFYVLGGLAATAAFSALHPESTVPMVGASGAVAAILGAYLVCYPGARVLTVVPFPLYLVAVLIPGIRIVRWLLLIAVVVLPAWLLLLGWFGLQAFSTAGGVADGVAYEAHVAGFVAGLVLVLVLDARRRRRGRQPFHPPRRVR